MVDLLTGNTGSGAQGLQLAAASRQTLSVLADYVGKVIEAQVVRTLTQPADREATNNRATPRGANERGTAGANPAQPLRATPPGAQAASTPGANLPVSNTAGATPGTAASQFLVTLKFFDQGVERQIVVRSELAPRIGQQLTLNVLDSQRLRIEQVGLTQPLLNSSKAAAASRGESVAVAANPGQRPAPTNASVLNAQQRIGIDTALRDTLPRQLDRSALLATYRQLAEPALQQGLASLDNRQARAEPAATIIQRWAAQLPRLQPQASPQQQAQVIRTAVEQSGLFYEPRLLQLASIVNQQQLRNTGTGLTPSAAGSNATGTPATAGSPSAAQPQAAANAPRPDSPLANRTVGPELPGRLPEGDVLLRQRNEQASRLGDAELAARRGELTEQLRNDQKQLLLSLVRSLRPPSATRPAVAEASPEQNPSQPIAVIANWLDTVPPRKQDAGDDMVNQLLRQLLGLLGRTQSSQLVGLGTLLATAGETQQVSQWNLEIPIWVEQKLQLVQLTLEQQADPRTQRRRQPTTWNVRLEFDFEQWGSMLALASLRGKTMAASIWAERSSIARRVDQELAQLRETLLAQGLQIHKLQCQAGVPEVPITPGSFNLLDTTS